MSMDVTYSPRDDSAHRSRGSVEVLGITLISDFIAMATRLQVLSVEFKVEGVVT